MRRRMVLKQRLKHVVRQTIGEPYVGKRLKLRRIARVLNELHLRPRSILDAGSGDAAFVYWLADRYPEAVVMAVDIDEDAIASCRAARPRTYAQRVEFEELAFAELASQSFDLITVLDVLEHIRDDLEAATALARALRPGGALIAHVPRDRWRTLSGRIHRVEDAEAWRINPGHVRQGYSPESLTDLLVRAGLRVERAETWLGPWGVLAHEAYARLERPRLLRLLSLPLTDACAYLDARSPQPEGNTVFALAVKP